MDKPRSLLFILGSNCCSSKALNRTVPAASDPLHLVRSSAPQELSSQSASHVLAILAFPPWAGADLGTPSLCLTVHMNLTFHCPYQRQQSRSCAGSSDLIAELWVGAAFPAFSLILQLVALLLHRDDASTASGHGLNAHPEYGS